MGLFHRLLRIRLRSALLLCLPALLLCAWYAWNAFAAADRYRRAVEPQRQLDAEVLQLYLFDLLRRDIRRTFSAPAGPSRRLDNFALHLDGAAMTTLLGGVQRKARRPYARAKLERRGKVQPVKVRVRGNRHWHTLGQQKSLKLRLPKGKLLDGYRVFNLINDPMPMVVAEDIILAIARKQGLLTPRSAFARVSLNGRDHGVYRFETQPDESLLRHEGRVPGSIYSGNLPPRLPDQALWQGTKHWKKVAARDERSADRKGDLARLLQQIREASFARFAEFARQEIDLAAFALFDALDVAFGGDQHDFRQNHKLHFDPYRGRWQPIAWNFRGFKDDQRFNLVENPLLLRLKLVPEYLSLRNRTLHELLVGRCSPAAVRKRGVKLLRKLAPELDRDPYWDAYKLLPPADRFLRRMVRPMDLGRLALVFESELTNYRRRYAFLLRELERNPLQHALGDTETDRTALRLVVDGRVGVRLEGLDLTWDPRCRPERWSLSTAGGRPLIAANAAPGGDLERPLALYPLVQTIAGDARRGHGGVLTEMVPAAYDFVLHAPCRPQGVTARAVHLATGSRVRSRALRRTTARHLPPRLPEATAVPRWHAPGAIGPHPWKLAPPAPQRLVLGPGVVEVPRTRAYGSHFTVTVKAGTHLRMGPGASLIFLGPVHFDGTPQQPIEIDRAGEQAWGGIALQGPGTAGSTLRHLAVSGGSRPRWRQIPYPAMVNIHDTSGITLHGCRLGENSGQGDLLHAVYVERLDVNDCIFDRGTGDGVDLEFVDGLLRNVTLRQLGDDGLDLMGSHVAIVDSTVVGCGGNGLSSGEQSEARLQATLIAACRVGVLAKNASAVELAGSLLHANRTGVRIYKRTVRYGGDSEVRADVLFVTGQGAAMQMDAQSRGALQVGRTQRWLPPSGLLDHLRDDVLGLDRWSALGDWLEQQQRRQEDPR